MKSSKSAIVPPTICFHKINLEFNLQNSECVYLYILLYSTLCVYAKQGLSNAFALSWINICVPISKMSWKCFKQVSKGIHLFKRMIFLLLNDWCINDCHVQGLMNVCDASIAIPWIHSSFICPLHIHNYCITLHDVITHSWVGQGHRYRLKFLFFYL